MAVGNTDRAARLGRARRGWRAALAWGCALCLALSALGGALLPAFLRQAPAQAADLAEADAYGAPEVAWQLEQTLYTRRLAPPGNRAIARQTVANVQDIHTDANWDGIPDFITAQDAVWALGYQWGVRGPAGVRRALVRLIDQAAADAAAENPGLAWDVMQAMAVVDYAYLLGWLPDQAAFDLTADLAAVAVTHYGSLGELTNAALAVCFGPGWGQVHGYDRVLVQIGMSNFAVFAARDYPGPGAFAAEQRAAAVQRLQQRIGLLPGGQNAVLSPAAAQLALPAHRLAGPALLAMAAVGAPLAGALFLLYWWRTRALGRRLRAWAEKTCGLQDASALTFEQLQALLSADDLLLDEIRRACRGAGKGAAL